MNIGDWIYKRARTYPSRPFLTQDRLTLDNQTFAARVDRMARVFAALGIAKGDRIATLMVNSSAFLELFFACARTGAMIVPLNVNLAAPELVSILGDCDPRVLIYSAPRFDTTVEAIREHHPDIMYRPHGDAAMPAATAFPEQNGAPAAALGTDASVAPCDPLLIMYTSGTTGSLKGAVLTHENFLFGAIHSLISYGLDARCKSLVVAPLFHIGALAASATPVIYAGGSLVIRDFDNPSDILHLIVREEINYMFAVPVMFKMMAKSPAWSDADFSRVRFFIAGGAPMPVALIRKYQEEKNVDFAQGYGMTETLRLTSLDLADAREKAGSIGKEVFHTLLRLVDSQGKEVPDGEVGEIIVKGPTIFAGYWRRPEATAQVMRRGWFHTGDLGRRDAEGFVYLEGRKSEMIICAGENIYAVEVEQAIETLPQVAEAAVIGVPDDQRGEVPAAFVVLKKEARLTAVDLTAALQGRIAAYKIPRKIRFMEALPRNSAGKVVKRELRI
ncbi:AMP-binding protein [Desulfatitalea tepidiphila]|uniref:AMP-binding protein n=1 Tax=Desulfatitalea tepidiphila TaxID=1185843 RepID=UPI0006B5C660|nr:AMP-binding protein [Desulfatitalea tepidiphila]